MDLFGLRERYASQDFSTGEKLFILALIAFIVFFALRPSPAERAAKEAAEKESQIGIQATAAGGIIAAGARACRDLGFGGYIDQCAKPHPEFDRVLVQDTANQMLAEMAVKARDDFLAWCPGPRTKEQCSSLLGRAIQLALAHPNATPP